MLLLDPLSLPLFFHRQQREQEKWFRGIKTVAEKKKKEDEKVCAACLDEMRPYELAEMIGGRGKFRSFPSSKRATEKERREKDGEESPYMPYSRPQKFSIHEFRVWLEWIQNVYYRFECDVFESVVWTIIAIIFFHSMDIFRF